MTRIKRLFLQFEDRHLHLRLAGSGTPVLLLHGSPNTSLMLEPLTDLLSRQFMVVAPDTPGNGDSAPLIPEAVDPVDYADALALLLRTLTLDRVLVYGFHTGAVFGAELARRYPDRVQGLICDGFPLWTKQEEKQLAQDYLISVAPRQDGSHLASIWSRVIDQNWYFPWHISKPEQRVDHDLGDVTHLHGRALEFLIAGDNYIPPYRAALRADGAERIAKVTAPALLTCSESDTLTGHLSRLRPQNNLEVQTAPDKESVYALCRRWFANHADGLTPYDATTLYNRHNGDSPRRFIDIGEEQVYAEGGLSPTALWLHDVGASSAQAPSSDDELAVDLPGHGLTTLACPESMAAMQFQIRQIIDTLGLETSRQCVKGTGLGARLADQLLEPKQPWRRKNIDIPPITPRWDGSHLFSAWHFCRFRQQYQDWQTRTPGNRRNEELLSAEDFHRQTCDLLLAGQDTLNLMLPYR